MMAINSGMLSGKISSCIILSNLLIGKILSILFKVSKFINWYTLYIEIILLVCFLLTVYLFISRKKTHYLFSILLVIILFLGFYSWMIVRPQFTTTALFCCASALLLFSVNIRPNYKFLCIISILLTAILIRKESWYIYIAFSLPLFIHKINSKEFRALYWKYFMVVGIFFFISKGLNNKNEIYVKEQTYSNIYTLDAIAANPTQIDTSILSAHNFTVHDIQLIQSWMMVDDNYLKNEKVKILAQSLKSHRNFSVAVSELKKFILDERYLLLMYAISLLAIMLTAKNYIRLSILNLFVAIVLFAYLIIFARLPHRISFPVLSYLIFSNLYLLTSTNEYKKMKLVFLSILTLLSGYKFYAVLNYVQLHKSYQTYYQACRKEINQNSGDLFIGAEAFPIAFLNAWESPVNTFPTHNLFLETWYPCSPDYQILLKKHQLKNLTSDLYPKQNIYFITEDTLLQNAYRHVMQERYRIKCHFESADKFKALKAKRLVFEHQESTDL